MNREAVCIMSNPVVVNEKNAAVFSTLGIAESVVARSGPVRYTHKDY